MASAKIFRINYKSDFILTLESDAGWMTPFCIKFWTGAPSQAYFVGWDGDTYDHCSFDPSEPTKLQVQFDDHHLPIGDLKYQVAYHFNVADFPNDTEDEVINAANITTEIDGETYQVMLDFTGETAPEIQFALPAYANEAQRIANEQQRIANEEQRIANEETRIQHEQQRIAAEQIRQQNEQQRINQEQARVNEYATLKADAVAATGAANDAAALANQKAQLAADKAALAQAAADLANAKAQLAADKAALAASSAQLANDKAALAQQKAEYAQTQGDYAKTQGDYAKEQGDTALADHQRAEADHGIAVDDHTQAGNDHTRAESDHGIAVGDHTQAGNDHTRAESDHTTASADHTQAGADHTRAESDHTTASADHTQAGADHTRAESDHTRAESDHAAVEVYVDSLGAFDISAYHATGGVLAKYADLTAALGTDGANIPEAIRKGGMSVKYVQSSDNNYVRCRLMADEWSTDVANWQGVDDEIAIDSRNLIESNGVAKVVSTLESLIGLDVIKSGFVGYITDTLEIAADANFHSLKTARIKVEAGQVYHYDGNSNTMSPGCFFFNNGSLVSFEYGTEKDITIPSNVNEVQFYSYDRIENNVRLSVSLKTNIINTFEEEINDVRDDMDNLDDTLSNQIKELSGKVFGASISIGDEQVGYYDANGVRQEDPNYHCKITNVIYVKEGDKFIIHNNGFYYFLAENVIVQANTNVHPETDLTVTIASGTNGLMVESYAPVGTDIPLEVIDVNENLEYDVEEIDKKVVDIGKEVAISIEIGEEQVGYYDENGVLQPYSGTRCKATNIIPVNEGFEFDISTNGYYFYYKDGQQTQSLNNSHPDRLTTITIPANVDGVKFTSYAFVPNEIVIVVNSINNTLSERVTTLENKVDAIKIPEIICRGDSVTEGMGMDGGGTADYGKSPYPAQLFTLLKDNGYNYVVINDGHSGEGAPASAARAGGIACYIKNEIQLPQDTSWVEFSRTAEPVNLAIKLKNKGGVNDYDTAFTTAGDTTTPVFIDGNYYNFKSEPQDNYSWYINYIQKISVANKAESLPAGSIVITNTTKTPYINTVFSGYNGRSTLSYEKWSTIMKACLSRSANRGFVIGCHIAIWEDWSDITGATSAEKYALYKDNCLRDFGYQFIDLYDEWFRHGLAYTLEGGYFSDKTQEELDAIEAKMEQHIVPAEFSYNNASEGNVHLNRAGYYVVARLIYEKMVAMKYIVK